VDYLPDRFLSQVSFRFMWIYNPYETPFWPGLRLTFMGKGSNVLGNYVFSAKEL